MKTRLLFLNQCFDKTRLRNLIAWVLYTKGEKRTIEIVEKLKNLGFQFATRAGISLSVDDLKIPSEKAPLVSQAKQQVALADREYERGSVTSIEKLQQLVDTWHRTSETLKQTVVSNFQATDKLSPVYMMAFSGARGNISQVRQLAGMRGLMADPQGQIIGFPIRSNFREGLTLTEYMISCYGARKGLVDTALRTADAGYLTRRLVDVSQHMVVKASTCATRRGIVLYDLVISGKSALSLRDRLIGRVLAQDVYLPSHLSISQGDQVAIGFDGHPVASAAMQRPYPFSLENVKRGDIINVDEKGSLVQKPFISKDHVEGSTKSLEDFSSLKGQLGSRIASNAKGPLVNPSFTKMERGWPSKPTENTKTRIGKRNQEISASLASQIASVQKNVSVRSPLTCSIRDGVCQLCYGWSLSEGRLVNLGEAVGIIAAQSIGEPGTQLTMRTFHTGGVFSGDVMTEIRSPYDGTAHFSNPLQGLLIRTSHGKIAFLTKSPGELVIQSNNWVGVSMATRCIACNAKGHRGAPPKSSVSPLEVSGSALDALHPDASQSMGHNSNNHLDNGQKQVKTLFTLTASTVVFIRHHEQVRRAQLIAEFSSMGTEVNETIEAKRTLFANTAGQISFASLLIGTQTRGNGDIVRVSRDLGFVWILSGRQPGPAALLELFQRGAHIVNKNTIIARVSDFCENSSLFVNTIDKKIQGMSSGKTIRRREAISSLHFLKKMDKAFALQAMQPSGPRIHDPNVSLLFNSRGQKAFCARFDFVGTRFVNGDGKQFLSSILYSLMPLTFVDGTKTNRFVSPSALSVALVKRATKSYGIMAVSSDDRNEGGNRALYRSIPSANTPDKGTLLGFKRFLPQEGVGGITDGVRGTPTQEATASRITDAAPQEASASRSFSMASNATTQEAKVTLNAKKIYAQQPMAGGTADTANHQSQYLRPLPKLSLLGQRSSDSFIGHRSALSIQRHASSYSLPSDNNKQFVSIKKGLNFVEKGSVKAINSDNVLVWVFPTQYKVTKKEMVWFDSRCLSQKLNFGELILVEKNLTSLCHGDTISTVSPVVTSCYKTISAKRRFQETVDSSQDKAFLPIRVMSANPLADRPSISNDKDFWNQEPKRLLSHHLQCLQAYTHHSQSLVEGNSLLSKSEGMKSLKVFQNKDNQTIFKTCSNENAVSPSRKVSSNYSVTSSKFPHLFAKASKINKLSLVNTSRGTLDGLLYNGSPPNPLGVGSPSNKPTTQKRLSQCNNVTATKSWIVNFENTYSFTKKKALKVQSEHFLHQTQRGVPLGLGLDGHPRPSMGPLSPFSRAEGYFGGFYRRNMVDAGEAGASYIRDGIKDPSKIQEAKTFQTNSIVLDYLTKIYYRAKNLNDQLGFEGRGEEKNGQKQSARNLTGREPLQDPKRSFIKLVQTSNRNISLSSVKELHTVTISSSIIKDRATRQTTCFEGDTTQPSYNDLGSFRGPSLAGGGHRNPYPQGFDGYPVVLPAMQRPYSFCLQNVKKGPFPKKHSSFWVYCPQEIHKVSVLHESVDLYRNWQFDNLCFDSSFTHIKGLFSSELLYQVKNHLDPIVSKLFLLSKRDTTFSQLCQPTGLLITQPLRTEMGGGKTISIQPYSNVFVWTSQPQKTLSGSNRQYLSVYHSYLQIENSKAGKSLKDSALSSVKKRDFVGNVDKSKLCKKKFLLHFAGPNMVDSLKRQKKVALEPLGVEAREAKASSSPMPPTPSVMREAVASPSVMREAVASPSVMREAVASPSVMREAVASPSVMREAVASPSVMREAVASPSVMREAVASPSVMPPTMTKRPEKDTSLPLLKKSSLKENKNLSLKTGVLFFLRKWMQIPQSCALHEGVIYLNKWDNASSLSKVLQIEQLGFDGHPVASPAMQRPYPFSLENGKKGWATTQTVKISAPCHGHKGFKVFFDTHSCFQSAQLNQKLNDIGVKQKDHRTKRYRFLVWKNLMNCKPFLLLRACPLQVQIVSNTKARKFLPIYVAHPLNWQSLVHASDFRKENLQAGLATSRRAWYKTLEEQLVVDGIYNNSTKTPKGVKRPDRLTSLRSGREANGAVNPQDLNKNSLLLGKESLYKLNLRQRLGFGPLPFKKEGSGSFFDSISNLEKEAVTNRVNSLSQVSDTLPITEVQQREICWPYLPQPTIFTAASKGCSISLPSITVLTTSHNSQSNFVATEKEGGLVGTGFLNNPKRDKTEITKLDTSPFRFVRKVKKTLLVTNCKPSYLSLMPLLLSKDFCTRVVSNESYLIRFFGNVSASLTNLRSIDSTVCDDSSTHVSSNNQLSLAMGEIVSQDIDFHLSESGRLLSQLTPSPSVDDEMLKPLLGSGPLQPTPSLIERKGLSYIKSLSHQGMHSNTVLLTEGDQLSMSFSEEKTNVSIGQFVTLGEEVVPGYAALVSGQVVAVEPNKVTLRRSQALLFYAQGVTHVNHGQWVNKNAPILTLTYQKLVTGDIVQGIPKIEQFFEAPATREGEPLANSLQLRLRRTYQRLKSLLPLAEAVKQSLEEIQQVLVEGILRVYLSQGVRIADKHLEIVIRQMTSKGQILDVGDTGLFQGEFVNLNRIERINLGTYGQKADYEPSVLGITQASLGSESFISAASFQETTRVLSRDTIVGKTDFLRGLKERVVLGDVIQVGTGLDDNINYGLLFGVTSN